MTVALDAAASTAYERGQAVSSPWLERDRDRGGSPGTIASAPGSAYS